MTNVQYKASKTGWAFHQSDAFVRGLMGPIGSGKSVACCWEIWRRANQQKPGPDGVRRSRWLVVRNTYRELQDTTIKTWSDWFSTEKLGEWRAGDMMHVISDSTMHVEVLFRALDRPDDVKKLLSLELTGAWINEARELPKAVLDMLQGRVGRYPSMREGGATWSGVFMDTNPPSQDHWWHRVFEVDCPNDWELFRQPSGRSPEAENIPNLPKDYYRKLESGHDANWISVYVDGDYGYPFDLTGTFYGAEIDRARAEGRIGQVPIYPARPVQTYWDLGLDDATAIWYGQRDGAWFNWIGYEEFNDVPLLEIAEHVLKKPHIYSAHYGPHDIVQREMTSALRRIDILHDAGLTFDVVPRAALADGIEATRILIKQSRFDSDACAKGIRSLASYRRKVNEELGITIDKPLHDWASHGADAFRQAGLTYTNEPAPWETDILPRGRTTARVKQQRAIR
jgi:hypothetical protein